MLTISGLTKAFGGRTLFADVSLQVNRQDRVGLVGPNGAGKTTLFSLILRAESPDAGEIALERNARLGYLPQETAPVGDETVLELATALSPEFLRLRRQVLAWDAGHPGESDFHDNAHDRFNELGGYQLMVSADIFRGRYRESLERPKAIAADKALLYRFALPTADHVFLPGHRIMVQVQSSWFPLYDRNPQTFVPSIFSAKPENYKKATQRVYHAPGQESFIELPLVKQ